jgi:hypothetical protein
MYQTRATKIAARIAAAAEDAVAMVNERQQGASLKQEQLRALRHALKF